MPRTRSRLASSSVAPSSPPLDAVDAFPFASSTSTFNKGSSKPKPKPQPRPSSKAGPLKRRTKKPQPEEREQSVRWTPPLERSDAGEESGPSQPQPQPQAGTEKIAVVEQSSRAAATSAPQRTTKSATVDSDSDEEDAEVSLLLQSQTTPRASASPNKGFVGPGTRRPVLSSPQKSGGTIVSRMKGKKKPAPAAAAASPSKSKKQSSASKSKKRSRRDRDDDQEDQEEEEEYDVRQAMEDESEEPERGALKPLRSRKVKLRSRSRKGKDKKAASREPYSESEQDEVESEPEKESESEEGSEPEEEEAVEKDIFTYRLNGKRVRDRVWVHPEVKDREVLIFLLETNGALVVSEAKRARFLLLTRWSKDFDDLLAYYVPRGNGPMLAEWVTKCVERRKRILPDAFGLKLGKHFGAWTPEYEEEKERKALRAVERSQLQGQGQVKKKKKKKEKVDKLDPLARPKKKRARLNDDDDNSDHNDSGSKSYYPPPVVLRTSPYPTRSSGATEVEWMDRVQSVYPQYKTWQIRGLLYYSNFDYPALDWLFVLLPRLLAASQEDDQGIPSLEGEARRAVAGLWYPDEDVALQRGEQVPSKTQEQQESRRARAELIRRAQGLKEWARLWHPLDGVN